MVKREAPKPVAVAVTRSVAQTVTQFYQAEGQAQPDRDTTMRAETGQHRNTVKGLLVSGRIAPFSSDGQNFGSVYLRGDVAGLILM